MNFEASLVREVLGRTGEEYTLEEVGEVCARAEYWLRNWCPEKVLRVNEKKNQDYYGLLTDTEKEWVRGFVDVLQDETNPQDDELMRRVYDICHVEDPKMKKNNQKRLFSILYQLVLNSSSGPRIPLLLHSVGKERLIALLGQGSKGSKS